MWNHDGLAIVKRLDYRVFRMILCSSMAAELAGGNLDPYIRGFGARSATLCHHRLPN
jgi:hypothetical protein